MSRKHKRKKKIRNKTKKEENKKKENIIQNVSSAEDKGMDKKMLIEAFVEAHDIIEEEKKKQDVLQEEKETKEWRKILGEKEYPDNEKWYLKVVHKARNEFVTTWSLLFFREQDTKAIRTTVALMKLVVAGLFTLCKWSCYFISLLLIVLAFSMDVYRVLCVIGAFFCWGIARLIRIAIFEITKIKDGNMVVSIFSGSISFAALVIAIITLIVSR